MRLLGRVWIKGETKKYRLNRVRRGVWVEALERENELYDAQPTGRIDAAIELLSHLQSSSPAAAVAGGWAAIEALLSEPDDRAGAADRLAMLVACSYPRAELTVLSYDLAREDDALAERLEGVRENRRRCDLVVDALSKREIDVTGPFRLRSCGGVQGLWASSRAAPDTQGRAGSMQTTPSTGYTGKETWFCMGDERTPSP